MNEIVLLETGCEPFVLHPILQETSDSRRAYWFGDDTQRLECPLLNRAALTVELLENPSPAGFPVLPA